MCTAINYATKDHYFGRNLDLELSYGEKVTITPRNYPFKFLKVQAVPKHYALIGVATIIDNFPLYYDATNEKGLSMAGLNFPGYADYKSEDKDKKNITPFEFIPWILSKFSTVAEVKTELKNINLVNIAFSKTLPLSPLHWIASDRKESITIECVKDGLRVYDNPIQVLTNNPTFDVQLFNLNNYMHLSTEPPVNKFSDSLDLQIYSRGMGAMGLPGDLSSMSRFVKASFTKVNAVSGSTESESISQFFHILGSVEQQRGCVHVGDSFEITTYSSCCNTDKGIFYYKTYENSQISAVDMHKENIDSDSLISYPLISTQQVLQQN